MNTISPSSTALAAAGVKYAPEIAAAASKYGLDPTLLAAVAAQETGGPDTNAGSNIVGDYGHGHGVFQIDDRWHDFASTADAMNPAKNADYAAHMLSGLIQQYGGDVHKALSAYNAGSPNATGTTTTWGDGKTLGYADSVLRHQARLTGGAHTGTALARSATASLTESCRADHADTYSSIDALRSLQSLLQAPQMSQMMTPFQPQPQTHSFRQMEGLDATGHRSDGKTSISGVVFDDGDDS